MKIKNKIFFGSLLSTSILTLCAGLLLFNSAATNLKEEVTNNLLTVSQNKAYWIRSYLEERRQNMTALAQTKDAKEAFENLMVYYFKERFYDLNHTRYKELYKGMDPFFRSYLETYKYHDIFFIGGTYGHVMYTAKRETPLGTNLSAGPYKNSGLAQLWRKTVKNREVTFMDFTFYAPSDEPAMFIGAPVFDSQGAVSSVVALQLGIKEINQVMKDRTGLGKTGDTYLVGQDLLMRSDSRFSKESTILKTKVDTLNTQRCFSDQAMQETKALIFDDYRGVSVLGSSVYIPSMKWALVAEITEEEALAPLHEMTRIFLLVGLMMIGIIYIISNLLGRRISRPIVALQEGAQKIMKGDLDYRTALQRQDELGELSVAFDSMTSELKEMYDHLEEKVRVRTKELVAVNAELDSFVYTASHDLRAPLRGISAFARFLEEDYASQLDAAGRDHLQEIRNGADRLSCLIDDLLTLSRITRIKNPYDLVSIPVLIDDILKRIEFDIKENKVDICVKKNMQPVMCDRIKMGEVFLNLINNAIKFSSKNNNQTPRVEIGYQEKDLVHEFFVKDNGIGIDPQYHERVFGIFKRLHKQGEYDGTGAGLSIVKRIIQEHGGDIWIESELGRGAKFVFTILKGLKNQDENHKT